MAGKVVHDIVEWFGGWGAGNMPSERTEESGRFMVRMALGVDFSIGVVEERENIHGSVAYVLELLETAFHLVRLQIGCKPF